MISGSGTGDHAALADLLTRIVSDVLDAAPPPLASTARAARFALDQLRAMALSAGLRQARALAPIDLEQLARVAGLPEIEALDFRRENGEEMTEPEQLAWRLIERFAALVANAAVAAAPSNRTPGAGPVAAS